MRSKIRGTKLGGHITERPDPWTDKLTQVNTTSTIRYAYDPLGRRIQRIDGANILSFHLNGKRDQPDYLTDQNNSISAKLNRGADGVISITYTPTSNPFTGYQLYSPHGDTTMITDPGSNIVYTETYDAFGNVINNPAAVWYGYLGKYERFHDSSLGAIWMGQRDYDPALGRFTSADPIPGTPTDSQQLNRYPYVGSDPLSRYDLSGLYWGESYVNAAIGAGEDYLSGGIPALARDWRAGFNSMSTGQQVALIGGPVVAGGALVAAEYVGPAYAAYELGGAAAGAFGPEVDDLLGDEEAVCPDELSHEPLNLEEQLAIEEAENGGDGYQIMEGKIGDPNYPEEQWAKMRYVHRGLDGTKITVHYWENLETGEKVGFKIK